MNLELLTQEAQKKYPNEPLGPVILNNYQKFLQEQDEGMKAAYLVSMELCSQLAKTLEGKQKMEQTYLQATRMFINSFLPKELYELQELFDTSQENSNTYQKFLKV